MIRNNRNLKAFSLIELSIVIVIVAILLTGALSVSITHVNNAKIALTKERMNQIYKAMGAYFIANKFLPCPAPLNIDKNNASYGAANTNSTCTSTTGVYGPNSSLVYGAVPTKTLELPSEFAEDGFGSKISYIVHKDFTIVDFTTSAGGTFSIRENPSTITSTAAAMFALISHGANKLGAFNSGATTQNTAPTGDELDNALQSPSGNTATFDTTFYSLSENTDSFDDIVFYKTRNQMIVDFNAFDVMKCTDASYNSGAAFAYGQTVYITTGTCTVPTNQKATKRCGAFGTAYATLTCSS